VTPISDAQLDELEARVAHIEYMWTSANQETWTVRDMVDVRHLVATIRLQRSDIHMAGFSLEGGGTSLTCELRVGDSHLRVIASRFGPYMPGIPMDDAGEYRILADAILAALARTTLT
jgi:hypothetical protein